MCSIVVQGREVRPRRAAEAFWRWEQALAICIRDIVIYLFLLFIPLSLLANGRGGEGGLEGSGRTAASSRIRGERR